LSLVKAIVEAHSGRVTVSSVVNQGAEFVVRLRN
jgi:signal transduction histidine kinase